MSLRPDPLRIAGVLLSLAIAACGSSTDANGGGGTPPPSADVAIVPGASTKGFQAYAPDTFTVHLNGAPSVRVVWRNDDTVRNALHTVTDTTGASLFSRSITAGDTASVSFTSAGAYPYKCSIHPGMRGLVQILP
jgi:plastocyanin